jgi:hypothetical protein
MATPQEQLEIAKQNLAAARQAYLTRLRDGDAEKVTQLEDAVKNLQEQVNREQASTQSTQDSTPSSEQKTVANNDDTNTTPPTSTTGENNPKAIITPPGFVGQTGVSNVDITGGNVAPIARSITTSNTVSNNFTVAGNDWRVRLSLAPKANYLYMDPTITDINKSKHILSPLRATSGVLFPYMPTISVAYRAGYDPSDVVHSNYRLQFYKGSSVDDIQITADFTAQDTNEAKYLLAVIHFFRSVTKMFYGQDSSPRGGTPPPLCYLSGLGAYQFNKHPLVISSFQYTLPTDVDYIRTEATTDWNGSGISTADSAPNKKGSNIFQRIRLKMAGAPPNAKPPSPVFKNLSSISEENSYVPTKMQITLGAHVIVTRSDVSKEFSLEKYASGELIKKGFW